MNIESPVNLSDHDLLETVKRLVQGERRSTVALILHLAEIDSRKLYLGQGCRSLFSYCMQILHLSESAAYNRIEAARVARRVPAVVAAIERGDVHLTAVGQLARLLTPENHQKLLAAAKHKSKREIADLIATLRPKPDVRPMIRKVPAESGKPATTNPAINAATNVSGNGSANVAANVAANAAENVAENLAANPANPAAGSGPRAADELAFEGTAGTDTNRGGPAHLGFMPPPRGVVVPLAPERYKVQFTASAATREKLRRAQELLRHRIPNGDLAEIVDLALDLLVQDLEKKKFAATERLRRPAAVTPVPAQPEPVKPPAVEPAQAKPAVPDTSGRSSRYIPAGVKRAVWQRDQGRCAFVSAEGERCTERGQLEFDHIQPHADGGGCSPDNVRLLCRGHNQYEARQFFGVWQSDAACANSFRNE